MSETRVREIVQEIMAAKQAAMIAGDADAIVALYAPQIVKFDLAPPLRKVAPLDAEALKSWFASFDGPVDYEIRDLEVVTGQDLAYCHSLNRLSATPLGRSEKFDLWFRETVCLRNFDGEWLVTHEHNSTPFYMDGSFNAALDLQP